MGLNCMHLNEGIVYHSISSPIESHAVFWHILQCAAQLLSIIYLQLKPFHLRSHKDNFSVSWGTKSNANSGGKKSVQCCEACDPTTSKPDHVPFLGPDPRRIQERFFTELHAPSLTSPSRRYGRSQWPRRYGPVAMVRLGPRTLLSRVEERGCWTGSVQS